MDDGGPVFPTNETNYQQDYSGSGISLRDHFAGAVFAAAMGASSGLGELSKSERKILLLRSARLSYEAADAMLAARKEPQ